jgi:hypothetical protein
VEGTDCAARLQNTARIGVGRLDEDVGANLNKQLGVRNC